MTTVMTYAGYHPRLTPATLCNRRGLSGSVPVDVTGVSGEAVILGLKPQALRGM